MTLLFVVELKAGWLHIDGWTWQSTPAPAWSRLLWIALLTNGFVAVGEEVLFRGYLLTGLVKAWGPWTGLAIMAILFSVPHLTVSGAETSNPMLFVALLALPGLLLGWAYLRTGSLWLPAGLHFAWNFMQDDVLNLPGRAGSRLVGAMTRQQGPPWLVGTSFGVETGLAGIALVVIAWLALRTWTRNARPSPPEAAPRTSTADPSDA